MTKKERIRGLLKKIRTHMKTDKPLYDAGHLSFLCYIFLAQRGSTMNCTVPNLTEWERAKLKSLLELFRPTKNELIELEPVNQIRYGYEFANTGVGADEPIDFCTPWFGHYWCKGYAMREFAFCLIVAMLEEEAK